MITLAQEQDLKDFLQLQEHLLSKSWSRDSILALLKSHHYLIKINIDDTNVGFLLFKMMPPEGEIITIIIHPAYQGTGLGQRLLEYCTNDMILNGCTDLFIDVADNNQKAIRFYKKNDFEEINRRKEYYKLDNQMIDAIVMRKNLKNTAKYKEIHGG